MPLPQLRRVRWAVRVTLCLGVAASVAANILHAQPNPVSQVIAAWPPLALLLTVELISRVPVHRRSLSAVRLGATTTIAGIAAWVSYWHMAGVAARYGESGASPYLLPLSVDGLIIVASVSLVELAGRVRVAEQAQASGAAEHAQASAPHPALAAPVALGGAGAVAGTASPGAVAQALAGMPAARTGAPVPAAPSVLAEAPTPPDLAGTHAAGTGAPVLAPPSALAEATTPAGSMPLSGAGPASRPKRPQTGRNGSTRSGKAAARPRRPVAETAALAARMEAEQPELSQDELAARLGITTRRLKEIKRQVPLRELQPAA